ncbi:GNAT family N-acetyltransferase [Streptomyces sp. A7024]|uniref:GNAT family N-acetyltransferase n=1 Tax=Streptomyces coryli TaxID=1128680 RepID=A0A6G4TVG1_9ACTN|nr:GNAT family N-acetyltransferase [Streptomyces coryli]NGN63510.1 GNAT family N-acetyltransferase [Streptomyces coryli]
MLTLAQIAAEPELLTWRLRLGDGTAAALRPLEHGDARGLAAFLGGLSAETRRLSTYDGYDLAAARELCAAIARYDKLRLVLEVDSGAVAGLVEFSLAIMPDDMARYGAAGIRLGERTDVRFGITLADAWQGRGVGTAVFPLVEEVARRLGRSRIILWGGVLADNPRALRFYEKNGFRRVGAFTDSGGRASIDMIREPV